MYLCVLVSGCTCIRVYVYQCVCVSVCPSISVSVCPCISVSVYKCVRVSVCPCINMSVHQCVRASVCPCCCLPSPFDPCLWGESYHLAFGPPASSSITPAGSVHTSRGDNVVRMWVLLKRWCVWVLQRGYSGDGCDFWRRLCVSMI